MTGSFMLAATHYWKTSPGRSDVTAFKSILKTFFISVLLQGLNSLLSVQSVLKTYYTKALCCNCNIS